MRFREKAWCELASGHRLTACSGGGSSGGRGRSPGRVGERGGGAKPYVGGARESFGGSGIIVLADDGRLAAQGTGHRRLARLEGIDHIHLKEGQPQPLESREAETERGDKTEETGREERLLERLE